MGDEDGDVRSFHLGFKDQLSLGEDHPTVSTFLGWRLRVSGDTGRAPGLCDSRVKPSQGRANQCRQKHFSLR